MASRDIARMPALTLSTDNASSPSQPSQPSQQHSPARSRSSSPLRPPYSPITPVLGAARLATAASAATPNTQSVPPPSQQIQQAQQVQQAQPRVYVHTQAPQTFIPAPAPAPETVPLDTNPDALALRSALSILQLQRRKATADILTLQDIKQRALADPAAFAQALTTGKIRKKPDPLFGLPSSEPLQDADESSSSDEGDANEPGRQPDANGDTAMTDLPPQKPQSKNPSWPPLPTPQTVVRTPPINWAQYAVMGDSLNKIHADQLARPADGLPARIGADGVAVAVEGGRRNEGLGVGAPYVPGRDRVEAKGAKKGGKR